MTENQLQNNNYIDIEEVKHITGFSKKTCLKILKGVETIETKNENGGNGKKLYNKQELLSLLGGELHTYENQATKISEKYSQDAIMLATGNILNNSIEKQIDTFLSLGNNLKNIFTQQKIESENQKKRIEELENQLVNKDEELQDLKNLINTIETNKGKIKELQKQFTDYVGRRCKKLNLIYSDVYSDIYYTLSKRYDINYSLREKKQSIIEYIASLSGSKKYLMELLTIAGSYFANK